MAKMPISQGYSGYLSGIIGIFADFDCIKISNEIELLEWLFLQGRIR